MLSAYISKEVNTDIYKFYTNNVFGSFILCIAIFYLSLYFNTSDIISIKQQISSINLSSNYFIVFILLLLIIGFVLTFLMFNIRSIESKKKMSFNVSTTNNIFMSASVGLYLIDYFLFDIFNIKMEKYVLYILYVILSSFVVYYSTLILFIKDNSVYNVFFNFVRINIYYCLLGIITQNSAISSNIMVLNILENCIINYPIYLISVYLGEVHHSTNYRLLDEKEYFLLKMFLIFLILFKICIPGTMSYYSARILTNFFGLSRNYLMLFVIYVNKIIAAAFLVKFFFFKGRKKFIVQTFEFKRGRLYQYKVSLVLSFLVIVIFMMVFWSPAMDWARGDWLATL
jgi:hypothetical protein